MFEVFQSKYEMSQEELISLAAEPGNTYGDRWNLEKKVKSAALILHDIGTKDERKEKVEAFKEGKIDFLFVYNMLLTGFDAPRLKKLYIGRVIKALLKFQR